MDRQEQPGGITGGPAGASHTASRDRQPGRQAVGIVFCEADQWVPGVIVGLGGVGDCLTIKLDTPFGGGDRHGLFHRESHGQDMVSVDDPAHVRPAGARGRSSGWRPDEILELVRAGKTMQAIKRYRALNGATLDEARAFFASSRPGA